MMRTASSGVSVKYFDRSRHAYAYEKLPKLAAFDDSLRFESADEDVHLSCDPNIYAYHTCPKSRSKNYEFELHVEVARHQYSWIVFLSSTGFGANPTFSNSSKSIPTI